MRVYVVDNGGQWTHREWRVLKYLGVESKIVPNTTPFDEIADVDGLVLSGGAPRVGVDASAMGRNGEYIDRADFPILGICAGHQFMALHLGGFQLCRRDSHVHGALPECLPRPQHPGLRG